MPETPVNERQKGNASLPLITLLMLVGLIAALLYVGYDSLADDTGNAKELTSVPLDTSDQTMAGLNENPENLLPDTSSIPAPVDLSQAPASPDDDITDEAASKSKNEGTAATAKADKPEVKAAKKPEAPNANGSSSTYTVRDGETLYGVASRLNMKLSTLKALNPGVDENGLKSGVTQLRVKVKTIHTVGKGDLLRVVAQKYGISKEVLMKANHKTKDIATRGERLIIPLPSRE